MKEHKPIIRRFLRETPLTGIRAASEDEILEKRNIILNRRSVTTEEAIRACGKQLLESGYIEEGYIQAMLERDRAGSAAVGNSVAIPHGSSESRKFVKRTGLSVISYPDGIDWNGEKVRLVIGIASKGEEHLEILKRIASLAADPESADRLVEDANPNTLYACLNGLDAEKVMCPQLEKKNIILNCGTVTPEEATKACGKLLVESGCVSEGYIQGMLERNAVSSVAVGNHVAIPHGTNASQKFVKRTGLAVITYPNGIQWEDKIVRLVIGIASENDEHLDILDRVVELAETVESVDALVDNATAEVIYKKLNGLE